MNVHSFIFTNVRLRDEMKESLIKDAAIKMVVEKGFDGLSMQKLAKEAGVSPATIYIYFKDRDDLLLQLYAQESSKMFEFSLAGFQPEMPFEEGLRLQWMNRANYCLSHPLSMHFLEQMKFSPLHHESMKMQNQSFSTIMQQFVANAIARKELVQVPVEVYWSIAFAPLYTLVKFHMSGKNMSGKPFALSDEMTNQTFELVLKALKPAK